MPRLFQNAQKVLKNVKEIKTGNFVNTCGNTNQVAAMCWTGIKLLQCSFCFCCSSLSVYSLPPPALSFCLPHSPPCQRHSGLAAGKQAEKLRTDNISLRMSLCACVRGPEWCWGTLMQSIVWIFPWWIFDFENHQTPTRLCQNCVFRKPHCSPSPPVSSFSAIVSSFRSASIQSFCGIFWIFFSRSHCFPSSLPLADFASGLTWEPPC